MRDLFETATELISRVQGYLTGISYKGNWDFQKENKIYVADLGAQAVKVVAGDKIVGVIDKYKDEKINPQDVYIIEDKLYVLDSAKRKIFVYEID